LRTFEPTLGKPATLFEPLHLLNLLTNLENPQKHQKQTTKKTLQVYLDDSTGFEIMLWSISQIIKLSALLFAWMYVVEAIKYEIATLEASKAAIEARLRGESVEDVHAGVLALATNLNGTMPDQQQQQPSQQAGGMQMSGAGSSAGAAAGGAGYAAAPSGSQRKGLLGIGGNTSHMGGHHQVDMMGPRLTPEAAAAVLEDVKRQNIETIADQARAGRSLARRLAGVRCAPRCGMVARSARLSTLAPAPPLLSRNPRGRDASACISNPPCLLNTLPNPSNVYQNLPQTLKPQTRRSSSASSCGC
jgi:hypothetical protein